MTRLQPASPDSVLQTSLWVRIMCLPVIVLPFLAHLVSLVTNTSTYKPTADMESCANGKDKHNSVDKSDKKCGRMATGKGKQWAAKAEMVPLKQKVSHLTKICFFLFGVLIVIMSHVCNLSTFIVSTASL